MEQAIADRLKINGIDVVVQYRRTDESPSIGRILEQAQLNGSMQVALDVAQRNRKRSLTIFVDPYENGKRATYNVDTGLESLTNKELTLHGFLMAPESEALSLQGEIQRCLRYIHDRYLKELHIDPADRMLPEGTPRPPQKVAKLAVKEYSVHDAHITKIYGDLNEEVDRVLVHADADLMLACEPIGRSYDSEQEYFTKEITPLFSAPVTAEDIARALFSFRSEIHKRFPMKTADNYHQGHLRIVDLALDDLWYMAQQKYPSALDVVDVTKFFRNDDLLRASQLPTKRIEVPSLVDRIVSKPKTAEALLKLEQKHEASVIELERIPFVLRR